MSLPLFTKISSASHGNPPENCCFQNPGCDDFSGGSSFYVSKLAPSHDSSSVPYYEASFISGTCMAGGCYAATSTLTVVAVDVTLLYKKNAKTALNMTCNSTTYLDSSCEISLQVHFLKPEGPQQKWPSPYPSDKNCSESCACWYSSNPPNGPPNCTGNCTSNTSTCALPYTPALMMVNLSSKGEDQWNGLVSLPDPDLVGNSILMMVTDSAGCYKSVVVCHDEMYFDVNYACSWTLISEQGPDGMVA